MKAFVRLRRNSGHRSRSKSRDKHERHRDEDNHRRHGRGKIRISQGTRYDC